MFKHHWLATKTRSHLHTIPLIKVLIIPMMLDHWQVLATTQSLKTKRSTILVFSIGGRLTSTSRLSYSLLLFLEWLSSKCDRFVTSRQTGLYSDLVRGRRDCITLEVSLDGVLIRTRIGLSLSWMIR